MQPVKATPRHTGIIGSRDGIMSADQNIRDTQQKTPDLLSTLVRLNLAHQEALTPIRVQASRSTFRQILRVRKRVKKNAHKITKSLESRQEVHN